MTPNEIIAALEVGEGPDRGLDLAIAEVIKLRHGSLGDWDWRPEDTCPHYTGSLDAAMTLVPEGYGWSVSQPQNIHLAPEMGDAWETAQVWSHFGGDEQWFSTIKQPARALCAAALKARMEERG